MKLYEKYEEYEDFIVCRYKVETNMPIMEAAEAIAKEQSTGTWTEVEERDAYSAVVLEASGNAVLIGFPPEDVSIEIGGIPQLLALVAGNLFGLGALSNVRLEGLYLPKSVVSAFPGPKFGIGGVRAILNIKEERPFVGTIVKPKIGLDPKETAQYVYEVGLGGLTHSKDDETLVNQSFCPLEERTAAVAEALDRVREETGRKMLHAINITTRADHILDIADLAVENGASLLMVDVFTAGFGAVQALAEDESINLPIHVHRTMHGAITRNPRHGISMAVFALLVRLAGGDALHIGTFGVGKMHGKFEEDKASQIALTSRLAHHKPVIPVCSGGLHPLLVRPLVEIAGRNIQIQAGGGIAGHPDGPRAGARAMVLAAEAATSQIPIEEYAQAHPELMHAIEKWG